MHTAKLSNISWRALHVWRRNGEVLLTTWYTNFLPPLLEPVFYVLAFGFGIGGMVKEFSFQGNEMSYLKFVAPGVVAVAVMFWAFFETTYSSFVRMYYQRTFDAMIATPLLVEDVIAGELLWGATKAFGAGTIMLGMLTAFDLPVWPSAFWVLPLAAVGGLLFSSIGIIVTALSPKIEAFNLPVFLLIFPMFLFSGTFFPLEQLPDWARQFAMVFPLTHVCALIRGASLDLTPPFLVVHIVYVLLAAGALGWLAIKLMYRRLVK